MVARCEIGCLNPEPSDFQFSLFRLHKANGTSPGNPPWYRNPGRRNIRLCAKFGGAKFPKLPTGTEWLLSQRSHSYWAPDPYAAAGRERDKGVAAYIAEFDRTMCFFLVRYR